MSQRIDEIKSVVERQEKCRAIHVESVVVREEFHGEIVWEGVVETFDLRDHPIAKRAYAWQRFKGGEKKEPEYTVVLGIPPVNSAQNAVRAAVVALYKNL